MAEKSTLEKYYISEKFDKERNVTFNLKKANVKKHTNFKTFTQAVEEFIKLSEKSKNDTRVWFHRDGAYRGSVGLDKAKVILNRVNEENVENHKAIEYIEKENLVDKSVAKVTKEKIDFNKLSKLNFDTTNLPKEIFALNKIYSQAIFDSILSERASRRQGTHSVKTRAEVRGGGKKPWRQKGTGRARAGSTRSPIWVGGGRAFGPRIEKNYDLKVNKKVKKLAFLSALTLLANNKSVVIDDFVINSIKTKDAVNKLNSLGIANLKHILVVSNDENVLLALSNLKNVLVVKPSSVLVEDLIWADVLVLSNEGLELFKQKGVK
ncbi:50S ribosomal protein L4 [Mycoplasma sp. 744]|uniref:50S ribosomal protein L4 n=1 Tax=unclassified Mycoplasma TaxID=2683645 RepID=UPI00211B857B|nr:MULTISPECIES: 50S ribosomal protein L4 [unclassified Mycoplasma]MEA4115195.1 50S ribosomal protein L4 [Mycoplasma sp. 744]UUM19200.1 50S ribosomal protein L4 [Mycoplasma sp. 1018B]